MTDSRPPLLAHEWIAGLEKGLGVIEAFDADHPRMTATEAGERCGMTRTAARRYLKTLAHLGYVGTDGKQYWLMPRSPRHTSAGYWPGTRVAAQVTAAGMAVLASMPEADMQAWLHNRAMPAFTSFTLDAQGLAQGLQDGDILTLLPISPAFGNAVTLQGAVAQPLRHAWFAGMRVADLIPDREALISPDFYKRRNQLVQNRIATLRAQGFTPEQIQALQRAEQLPEDMALSTELITRNLQPGLPMGADGKPAANRASAQNGQPQAATTMQLPGAPAANNPTSGLSEQELQSIRERQEQARNPVERVRGFAEQINWEYAVIQRLNKAELKTELIPFNLAKAVIDKDPAHNIELMPGDVVTIFGVDDIPVPLEKRTQFVRLGALVGATMSASGLLQSDAHGTADGDEGSAGAGTGEGGGESDPLYDQAVAIVLENKRPSISLVQRHLRIGYNRAARLLEDMEKAGLVSKMGNGGNREILHRPSE